MSPEVREWSVPAPVRTLLWWPAISFVLVIIAPDAAVSFIIAAGALLAVLGAFLNAAAQRARQSITDNRMAAPASSSAEATLDVPTVVLAPIEGAPQQRVA